MSRIYDSIYGYGGRQYQNPSLAASGAILNGETSTTEYSRKMTGSSVYCINFEDQYLTGGMKTTAIDVGSSSWCAAPSGNLYRRKAIVLHNHGSNTVYITGNSGLATTEAFPLLASSNISFDLLAYQQLWARTLSGVSNVRILEVL